MAIDKQSVDDLIIAGIVQLRSDLDMPEMQDLSAESPILGGASDFDSMAVVHLIVDLEARLQEAYGLNWILADERALSRNRSPFRTVGDLRDFILETQPES